MEDPCWNLDELAERVDAALAVDYHGQPSGRVRAVPDRRAIRWYTTIGLIDRPVAYRGRTALYGPRHLLQLVAVKRLQAKGLALVAIQQELAGATDTQLARVANLPAGTTPGGAAVPDGERSRTVEKSATERTAARTATGVPRVARAAAARRAGFWRQQPAAAIAAFAEGTRAGESTVSTGPGASADPGDPTASVDPVHHHPNASADPERTGTGAGGIATLQGIRLGEGATLLLEPGRELDAADVHAILDAAGPLLSALRERGLSGGTGSPARRIGRNEPRREQP